MAQNLQDEVVVRDVQRKLPIVLGNSTRYGFVAELESPGSNFHFVQASLFDYALQELSNGHGNSITGPLKFDCINAKTQDSITSASTGTNTTADTDTYNTGN